MRRFSSLFLSIGIHVVFLFLIVPPVSAYYTNMSASVVVGQTDFTTVTTTPSQAILSGLQNAIVVNGKLIVDNQSANRILIWNSVPTTNGVPADVVLGQPNFISTTANNGGISAKTFSAPTWVTSDGSKLIVSDRQNSRVLIWNSIPTTNFAPADVVIGQSNFTNSSAGTTVNTLNRPEGVFTDGKKLYIADSTNNRVLIYNTIPTTNNASANIVLGQPNFTSGTANNGGRGAGTMSYPTNIFSDGNKLIVTDSVNNRVLIWNSIPTINGSLANVVVGQANFTSGSSNQGGSVAANTLYEPIGVGIYNNRLFIADPINSRVLIYNQIPSNNNTSASIVLGQPNFTSDTANNGGIGANTLNIPTSADVYNNQLFVADATNRRLLIFSNTLPDTKLTNVLVSGEADGKQKLQGKASTNVVNGVVRYVEYSINGSTWTGATPSDGAFDEVEEDYSFVFDPKSNNPDIKNNEGFVVRVRNTHNNTVDSGSSAVYFEPFVAHAPQGKPLDSNQSFGTNPLPSFSFSINTWRFEDLVRDLDSFRVSINKDNQGWIPYIENIPVSYEGVRDTVDNKRRSIVATSGNGVYEDTWKVVSYTSNNGTIEVQGKAVNRATGEASDKDFFNGGMKLPAGTYQWRVEAVDRAGHVQATSEKTLYLSSFQKIVTKRWFPLTITSFSGVSGGGTTTRGSSLDWSSIHPQDVPSSLTITTTQPMIKGIASVGATVTLQATNKICLARGGSSASCTISASTIVGGDSRYTLTAPRLLEGNDYTFIVSVTDVWGNGNRLPEMSVGVE